MLQRDEFLSDCVKTARLSFYFFMARLPIHRLDHSEAQESSLKTSSGNIVYTLLRSPRRKTMEISVTQKEQVRVVAPVYTPRDVIDRFLRERESWIRLRLEEIQRMNQFVSHRGYVTGQEFLFLGKNYPIHVDEKNCRKGNIQFDDHGWVITIPAGLPDAVRQEKVKRFLIKWYRQEALEVVGSRVFHFVRVMGLEPMTIAVKTQRSVWGLCAYHQKSITLNWLLVLAPIHVIDYVIVHELAHLTHPNHSKRFWNKVERFLPDYKERQDWLKYHRLEMRLP